ncbi:protein kinase domain-containing protein [Polyangium jinanense]|uniref:Protein kinase n=1 Tax=Polyangium jinanense TaxID=2829994 RepID=A0A9X3XEY2_9BACT|nr:protein kinase [Polyangium jinanense]MDC3961598.1 protein kinase [Polyangium jinanense]MDC3988180.1 protein kinase [Polyangium jinanense]
MLKASDVVAGRFEIEAVLGEGGMGIVYRAHDLKLARKVALKTLAAGDEEAAARALREARAVAALDHPNAIAIYDAGEWEGQPFIAMELVEGETLRAYVGDPSVPVRRKIRWLVDVARTLAAAHRAGIVHRDIKPENVMVRRDGRVKVLDFGIARRSQAPVDPAGPTAKPNAPSLATKGGVSGTPMYMAPEQVRGKAADGRTDQFSWAVLGYELCEGTRPWDAHDALSIVAAMMSEPPRPMQAEGVPAALREVLGRALGRLPAERYGSMDDIVELLEPLAEEADSKGPKGELRVAPRPSPGSITAGRYSTQELGQAIALALERKAKMEAEGRKYAYADLAAAAREVGVEEGELRAALLALRPALDPVSPATPPAPAEGQTARRARQKQKLVRHAAMWGVFSVFFFLLDMLTAGGVWWFFPVLGWGVGLAAHAVKYLTPVDPTPEEEAELRLRQEIRREKLARKRGGERMRIAAGGKRVEELPRPEKDAREAEEVAELAALAEEEAGQRAARGEGRRRAR